MDIGLLVLRVVVGLLFVAHGTGKLFGWFQAGHGVAGTSDMLAGFDFRPARPWALVNGLSETAGGALLALGLLTPLGAAMVIGVMLVAARTAHAGKGPWVFAGGWEYPLAIGAVATALAFAGPGAYSLDRLLGLDLSGWTWGLGALVVGLGAAVLTLTLGRQPAPAAGKQPADREREREPVGARR